MPHPLWSQLERDESSEQAGDAPQTVIWGTDINASLVERKVSKFLTTYSPPGDAEAANMVDAPAGKYARLLRQVRPPCGCCTICPRGYPYSLPGAAWLAAHGWSYPRPEDGAA